MSSARAYRIMERLSWGVPLLGAALVAWYGALTSFRVAVLLLLIALGALVVGIFVGFLFGIPRARQAEGTDDKIPQPYTVNTNLEQISDWLTKILVGVGLVELGKIPSAITRLSNVFGSELGTPQSGPLVAGVVVVLNAGWGFLAGYMLTRTYLTTALRDSDRDPRDDTRAILDAAAAVRPLADDPARRSADLRPPPDGEIPPSHNREPLGILTPTALGIHTPTSLADLHKQITEVLRIIVGSTGSAGSLNAEAMLAILERRGVLSQSAAKLLRDVLAMSAASNRHSLSPLKGELEDGAVRTLYDLASVVNTAPARFESHVISILRQQSRPDWEIIEDSRFPFRALDSLPSGRADVDYVRVDALIRDLGHSGALVVVEVRAQITDEDPKQLDGLSAWIRAIPPECGIVLVVPSAGNGRRLARIIAGRDRARLLSWDDESFRLIPLVGELLESNRD